MTQIVRVEAFALSFDHHYKVAGLEHRPGALPGTSYYLEPAWAQVYSTTAMTCLLRVTCDDGSQGWGEAQAPIAPEVNVTIVESLLGPALLGQDPADVAAQRDRLAGLMDVRGHHAGYFADTVTGLDLALWDLAARHAQQPLATLLGGDRGRPLPLYVSGLRRPSLAEQVAWGKQLQADGYQGFKLFLSGAPEAMAEHFTGIRSALGPETRLMVDLLWGQSLESAKRFAELVEPQDLEFLEAPLPLQPLSNHADLARATTIPLAAGEQIHTVDEAYALLDRGVRVLQPDVARTGITEGLRIAAAARQRGADVTWHVGVCSPVATAASWAIASTGDRSRLQEYQVDLVPAMSGLVTEPLEVRDGQAFVPAAIEIDEQAVRAATTRSCDVRLR
jgi:D-galactarolactone cycloisomerase